jgi:hypothetical protein
MTLYDFDGDALATSAEDDGSEHINYTFQVGDRFPFYVQLASSTGYSDYRMTGSLNVDGTGYDEIEHNDGFGQENTLPPGLFSGFKGNVGAGGQYDGDAVDMYTFAAGTGQQLKLTIDWTNTAADISGYVTNNNGERSSSFFSLGSGTLELRLMTFSSDSSPYHLTVNTPTEGYSDYTLKLETLSGFDETEDNDSSATADALPAFPFTFYRGSVGTGGSDYDGDNVDWFQFTASVDDWPYFLVFSDTTTGAVSAHLYDSEGDLLATGQEFEGHLEMIDFSGPIDASDVGPYRVKVETASGYSDYWIEGGLYVPE